MVNNLVRYFTEGTQRTTTFGTWGAEVETHLVDADGQPISREVSQKLLAAGAHGLPWGGLTIDLGRQLFELQIKPCDSPQELTEMVHGGLTWLYMNAAKLGAQPLFEPVLFWDGPLLWEPDNRDANAARDMAFIQLDGRRALERLCRIAAVQFTVSINPRHAIDMVNRVLAAQLERRDYPNGDYWRQYIYEADAGYAGNRYGGPSRFASIEDYASYMASHPIIMRRGQICEPRQHISDLGDSHEELGVALRNVWNYVRLRRYGNTLAMEVRPFSRRGDSKINTDLAVLRGILGC